MTTRVMIWHPGDTGAAERARALSALLACVGMRGQASDVRLGQGVSASTLTIAWEIPRLASPTLAQALTRVRAVAPGARMYLSDMPKGLAEVA